MALVRCASNPILSARDIPFDASLIFNAGVCKFNGKYVMVFRNDVGLPECVLLERGGYIYAVVSFKKSPVGFCEVLVFYEVIPVFPGISCLEQCGTFGFVDGVSYESEFFHGSICLEFRCLIASYRSMAAETDTLRESSLPSMGILMCSSAFCLQSSDRPDDSAPMTMAVPTVMSVSNVQEGVTYQAGTYTYTVDLSTGRVSRAFIPLGQSAAGAGTGQDAYEAAVDQMTMDDMAAHRAHKAV